MPRASQTCSSTSRSIRFERASFGLPYKKIYYASFISLKKNQLLLFKALQKDVVTNASALNEVISSTKKFLEDNRSKLTPDQIAAIEGKLEEAKSKAKLINQRAEDSRKDLEKAVTTAIQQESEKVPIPPIL